MISSFQFQRPLASTKKSLRAGWGLLSKWKKEGRTRSGHSIGFGWHELRTNKYAGFHASCYGLKLIANKNFPVNERARKSLVKEVAKLVTHTIEFPVDQADPKDRDHYLEAQNSTIKVANYIAACAAVGRNKNLKGVFRKLQTSGRKAVQKFLNHEYNGKWEHWLTKPGAPSLAPYKPKANGGEIDTYYPTATVYDALYRFGKVDLYTRAATRKLLRNYARTMLREFLALFEAYGENPPIKELWKRLPALRTIAIFGPEFYVGSKPRYEPTRLNFERIFNSYLRHELFSFELNHTDDFQKFDGNKAVGTDYVSFNTTACLARAILGAVRTHKLSPAFCEWVAPHLCKLSEQITKCRLPRPERFSYIHQAFSCSLAAVKLENETHCFPKRIRMEIYPRVFSQHAFRKMTHRGFYVTPFGLGNSDDEVEREEESDRMFCLFRAACRSFDPKILLVRADHAPLGVITERIWRYLNESRFIVAICAGANPNVYYEIGIADTLGKPVLLIGRSKHKDKDFRFDIQGITSVALNKFEAKTIGPVVKRFLKQVYVGEL
jgi:hypothetical protein